MNAQLTVYIEADAEAEAAPVVEPEVSTSEGAADENGEQASADVEVVEKSDLAEKDQFSEEPADTSPHNDDTDIPVAVEQIPEQKPGKTTMMVSLNAGTNLISNARTAK